MDKKKRGEKVQEMQYRETQRIQNKVSEFSRRVYNVVRAIRRGEIMTYAEVARAVGRPQAYRVVGNALNKNYDPGIPCHRVIRSDGKIGGYNRGAKLKLRLLRSEGVILNPKS